MKYFTKSWYELCQKTSEHLLLTESKEAENFSENYFRELYEKKLSEWLVMQEEVSKVTFDQLFPEEMSTEYFDENISEEDIAAMKASYNAQREAAKASYKPPEPLSADNAAREFYDSFINNQERVRKVLPEYVLGLIPDIRVYVLGKASRKVIQAVARFCEENQRLVNKAMEEYQQYCKDAYSSFDKDIVENTRFHDCVIKDIKQEEKVMTISFDNSGGFTDVNAMRLEDYKIIKQEGLLLNSWWLYEEIYKADDQYELHALLQDANMKLIDLTVSARNYIFTRSH